MTGIQVGQHAPHLAFEVRDDCLQIGGMSLTELTSRVGRTPYYAYDRAVMSKTIVRLRDALPQSIHLHFAMKANPMPAVVKHIAALVDGLDVASVAELKIALETGTAASRISFAGPGKTRAELAFAVESGITINIESPRELAALCTISRESGKRPQIAVRVNPDFELKTSGMKMGGGPKQFGVDAELVPSMLAELKSLPVDFLGFHIFSGSQNLRPEAIVEAQQKTVALAERLSKFAPSPVRVLNIGGGFGIPYFPGEQPLELKSISENLVRLVADVEAKMPGTTVIVELGRFLVGESGIYVCRVVDRKVSRGQVFLVTDGGLHHHLAASGNFGQILRKNYPVLVGNHVTGSRREIVSVVGPLCTPLDLLADKMEMAHAEENDLIVVLQSGAYGLTASPLGFLSHPAPAEILL